MCICVLEGVDEGGFYVKVKDGRGGFSRLVVFVWR